MMNFIRSKLKFLMWVVAFGFVGGLFFIGSRKIGPSWIASIMPAWLLVSMPGCARSAGILVKIGDYNVKIDEFKRVKENNLEIARWRYKDQFDTYAGNLDFDKITVESITRYAVLLHEADKQKIYISNEEVQEAIKVFPDLMPIEVESRVKPYPYYSLSKTQDGVFNPAAFRRVLESQGKVTPDIFSDEVKNGLRIAKLKNILNESAIVTDLEMQQEYKKQNEKAKVKYIEFPIRDFTDKISVTDAELQGYFQKNILNYKLGDRVNISFIKIDPASFQSKVAVNDAEVINYYKNHRENYFEPEKVKAVHLLVKVDSSAAKDQKAKARAYAEEILKDAKKPNADFSALQKKYSNSTFDVKYEDLGSFEKGKMEKPFEDAAFSITPGSVGNNLVETNYGYHIIRVDEKQAPKTKTLEEVRGEIISKLASDQATVLAEQKADDIQYTVILEENLQSAVDANPDLGLRVMETGFFAKGDQIPMLGPGYTYRDLVDEAFKLKKGEISSLVKVKSYGDQVLGFFVFKLIDRKPGSIPTLNEVKDKVTRDLKDEKAKKLAMSAAAKIAAERSSINNLDEIAKKNNMKINESEPFAFSPDGYIRSSTGTMESKSAMLNAFGMNPGDISGPYEGRYGVYIIQLVERIKSDSNRIMQDKTGMAKLKDQILKQKQQKIYDTWYQKVKSGMVVKSFMKSLEAS